MLPGLTPQNRETRARLIRLPQKELRSHSLASVILERTEAEEESMTSPLILSPARGYPPAQPAAAFSSACSSAFIQGPRSAGVRAEIRCPSTTVA